MHGATYGSVGDDGDDVPASERNNAAHYAILHHQPVFARETLPDEFGAQFLVESSLVFEGEGCGLLEDAVEVRGCEWALKLGVLREVLVVNMLSQR